MFAPAPKFVRVQDRLTLGSEDESIWRVNPRTGFLETRAGLSWTGVREYRTPSGIVRVLRRPEQVNSRGHLRTLRLLPCTDGHPSGDRDVLASNSDELKVGSTGDRVTVEEYNGYSRPVGNVAVHKPAVIAKMLSDSAWRDYCETFDSCGVERASGPAATGTSLGYNALWYSPHREAEIVQERDDGALVGEWAGPFGPERYDVEHIINPDCELVQELAAQADFDPDTLGGNHCAVALRKLGGRGAEQSELMRIVDSRELITPDMARKRSRLSVQVPRSTRDMKWTVDADRDLPIDKDAAPWDGAKAAADIFDFAGWPDNPKPEQARRFFLLYDADAPELKASYKDPFARRSSDGRMVVPDSGIRAAASGLSKTEGVPAETIDRARDVVTHYQGRFETARDSADAASEVSQHRENPEMTVKTTIEFGVGRDNERAAKKLGIAIPTSLLTRTMDMMDVEGVSMKLGEMQTLLADVMEMLAEAKAESAEMKQSMEDAEKAMAEMPKPESVEEMKQTADAATQKVATLEGELESLKTAHKAALAEQKKTIDSLTQQIADAPKLRALKDSAKRLGFDAKIIDACETAAGFKRAVVFADEGRAARHKDANDETISLVFEGIWTTKVTDANEAAPARDNEPEPAPAPSSFDGFPMLAPPSRDSNDNPSPVNVDGLGAALAAW